MDVDTITGRVCIRDKQQLEVIFHEHRQGAFRAFHFFQPQPYPWLSVLINGSLACLHYFSTGGSPGFQSQATATSCSNADHKLVHFLQPGGSEADGFDLPASTTVPTDLALRAARQFFDDPSLPTCIQWLEL